MMLKNLVLLFIFCSSMVNAQTKASNQKVLLQQYLGTWYSADQLMDKHLGKQPKIKMEVLPKMENNLLQVDVFEWQNSHWQPILAELISYDATTDQIVAFGHDRNHQCFVGKGYFTDTTHWQMSDINFKNEATVNVAFHFINDKEVLLKGVFQNAPGGWDVKYIKQKL
jgi:hypothetical protein